MRSQLTTVSYISKIQKAFSLEIFITLHSLYIFPQTKVLVSLELGQKKEQKV